MLNEVVKIGEWSETIQAFWFGAMDFEYIAWKGSHQILVYPCWEYPNAPSEVIQHTKRIETVEDFDAAMSYGIRFKASYEQVGTGVSGD